ncbi:uncharacterized protein LOC112171750 [Rosa chinensis]|uniref:uncharacterized protein LOC112171750 n=1 Tax=Rosa chinensis TaxID=74649 RepID=UPI000D0892DA|nr:uncharacterized protein LOC112171750 [Rosa chinensis]
MATFLVDNITLYILVNPTKNIPASSNVVGHSASRVPSGTLLVFPHIRGPNSPARGPFFQDEDSNSHTNSNWQQVHRCSFNLYARSPRQPATRRPGVSFRDVVSEAHNSQAHANDPVQDPAPDPGHILVPDPIPDHQMHEGDPLEPIPLAMIFPNQDDPLQFNENAHLADNLNLAPDSDEDQMFELKGRLMWIKTLLAMLKQILTLVMSRLLLLFLISCLVKIYLKTP